MHDTLNIKRQPDGKNATSLTWLTLYIALYITSIIERFVDMEALPPSVGTRDRFDGNPMAVSG